MLSILCAARGESFARLAVGQTKLRHGPAPIFDFHSSMQTARRNRQTPKEFSPILHITLHCTVLRCTAPHRTVRSGPRVYGSVVVVLTRYPDVELALNRTVKARKLHLLSGVFLPVENQVGY